MMIKELQEKYAKVILSVCLKIKENQPLFISANSQVNDFVRIIATEAYELGVKDIYFDLVDVYLKHDALKNLTEDELKDSQYWNKTKWNEYAQKDAAFLMLASETPELMNDISKEKINNMITYSLNTRRPFDERREKNEIAWCIAAVPTIEWAKQVFPKSENPVEDLWQKIFYICHITENNPERVWDDKINKLSRRGQKLTSYQFQDLIYQSSNGTNFKISLPQNHIWCSGKEKLKNGLEVLVNFPTEEIFTSPTNDSASGIIYSSKPLSYQDSIIDEFWLKFENGEVTEFGAKKGEDSLKQLLNSCQNINRLGEVALVEYDSPISNTNLVYYETLFDENSSCHLALGDSFAECIKEGTNKTKDELSQSKLNNCLNHVDFMIGTKDLKIVGITKDKKEITIIENGNFTKEFK